MRLLVGFVAVAVVCLGADQSSFSPAQRKYWALQPISHPQAPAVKHRDWVVNPIDAFIAQKLEAKGLSLSPAADRVTLLRRVTFDLVGLPPTPEEVDAFVADKSPNAYEKVVDRLLASPRYGERWARHWLDLARYAESEGFKADETRPNAWRYRDYVIQAFNQNKPYDRFVKEQIAGDEMWPDDPWARVATGFNRHYPDESNARNLWQRRQEILNDITDTVGSTFLGMTYGCARCHTHKFDPILHADYYRLQAFFANTAADDEIPMISAAELSQFQAKKAIWEEQTKPVRDQIAALLAPKKEALRKEYFDKYPAEIQALLLKPGGERNPLEWQMAHKAQPYLVFDDESVAKSLKGMEKARYQLLLYELKKFASLDPGELPIGIGMKDLGAQAPATHILNVGAYDAPLDEVQPGFLSILDPTPAKIAPTAGGNSSGRRTALANWIASPENPLTARVMVNRIWFHHFGAGIAPEPSDFGAMGGRPSHPELLDWLASEFVRSGWDMKAMHKLMVLSKTYQQSSAFNEAAAKEDPRDKLLWRFPRERLEGEVIRDAALSVSGLLNSKMGGPSIFPELPAGAGRPRGGWAVSAAEERNRRSVYVFVRRNSRYPMLEEFDMPDTHESCGRRNKTITAPQAMSMLNGQVSLEWAEAFAGRLVQDAGSDANRQIDEAFRLAFGRHPDGFEKDTVQTFFQTQRQLVAARVSGGEKLALPAAMPADYDPVQAAALVDFCQMLLNSNEFVYRN
jgi:Protein of unknown function (DUF1553)/Protein of unknown function (DUF1549)